MLILNFSILYFLCCFTYRACFEYILESLLKVKKEFLLLTYYLRVVRGVAFPFILI